MNPIFHDVEQNSDDWDRLRTGKVTSSNAPLFMANLGKSFGDPAKKYALQIALERITGMKSEYGYSNKHMERGHEQEPIARMLYEDTTFSYVTNGGFYDCGEYGDSPDGRVSKTQTRRPVDDNTLYYFDVAVQVGECHPLGANEEIPFDAYHLDWCPYGKKGDVIPFADKDGNIKGEIEIVDVWLQRVQEISQEDAIAEGVVTGRYGNEGNWLRGFYAPGGNQPHQNAKSAYSEIWRSIYGVEAWYKNPWVWVIEFKQIQG